MALATAIATIPTKEERIQTAIENPYLIVAERCRRSLYHFMHVFWDVVSNDAPIWNWHIEYICDEITKIAVLVGNNIPKQHDLIINIPPGTTKSITINVMLPAWCWTRWFWMRFIASSYSSTLSLEQAELCRDLIRSDKFRRIFPDLSIKKDKDQKGNFKIEKTIVEPDGSVTVKSGGNRFSTSVGATIIGFHGHINIWDDALNPREAASAVELKSSNDWIDQELSRCKANKLTTTTIGIQQRLAQNDTTGHLLERKTKTKHICLPGEIFNYRDEVKPVELIDKYVDGLLDPVRMPRSVLTEMEAELGQYGYAGQVGQRPTPPGGGMFKVAHFQQVDKMPPEVSVVKSVRYWDKAATADDGAYTVGTKMHQLQSGKWLISDVKRGQWSTNEREDVILETTEADNAHGNNVIVWMEQEGGSGGKGSAEATIRNLAGYVSKAESMSGKGNKVFRADPYSVQVNSGNILLLTADWNYEFIEEHRFFPFSTYLDQVDSAAGAFSKLTVKRLVRSLLKSRA